MAKICISEKTASRQRWIEQGLLELMRKKKYGQLSVTELCLYLGLSRRSFYRYFCDLDDVIDSLIDHTFQNLAVVPLDYGIPELQRCFEFWMERKEILEAFYYGGMIERLFLCTMRYTDFHLLNNHSNGIVSNKESQLFVIGGFMSLVLSWSLEGFEKTPEEMAQISYNMLYKPFLVHSSQNCHL